MTAETVPDYAKRCADIVNYYITVHPWDEIKTKCVAIRLSDGGHDGNLYDNKRDAVRHQSDEFLCAYVFFRNCMGGITPKEAQTFMDFSRKAYDAGMRLPDPDHQFGGPDVFMSTAQHDFFTGRINARIALPTADQIKHNWRK